jgi:hypothetical protein
MLDEIRKGLIDSFKHRKVEAACCVACGRTNVPLALHVIEFYHPDSTETPPALVPMSRSRGTTRGSVPLCNICCPPCRQCSLPIATPWTKKLLNVLKEKHQGVSFVVGNGICKHIHVLLDIKSLFRSVRLRAAAWKPRPFHENKSKHDIAEWFAHVDPWTPLDPRIIQLLIQRLYGNPMFEVFVHASQDCNVVSEYAPLRALFDKGVGEFAACGKIAQLLTAAGVANGVGFTELMRSPKPDKVELGRLYANALNACEAAVNVEPSFLPAYGQLALLRQLTGKTEDAISFCEQGLAQVEKMKTYPLPRRPEMNLAGSVDDVEEELRAILRELARE